ncbi:MAG: hypothetical protein ACR2GG_10640 [Gemmatimonadaceae bacterium]
MTGKKTDLRVDKRRVTMVSLSAGPTGDDGNPTVVRREAVDYVRPDFLDAYVADAQSKWQSVVVSEEPDAGPGGYHGATSVPAHLEHPLAGETFDATEEGAG